MNKKNILLSGLLIFLVLLLIGILVYIFSYNSSESNLNTQDNNPSTNEEGDNTPTKSEEQAVDMETLSGISLSPKSYTGPDFAAFMEKVDATGEILTSAGNIEDLANENSGAHTVANLGGGYNYTPVTLVHVVNSGNKGLKEPLTAENQQRYLDSIETFLTKYDVKYFGMGVEVNMLFEHSPEEYTQFVEFFSKVDETVHTTSPNTKLLVVFQLERIKGLKGGLFGETNDLNNNNWNLINDFPGADIIGFTTYPYLIYSTPSEIPADYYLEIPKYTQKEIAFIEVGWPWKLDLAGWESSETEQVEFIQIFTDQSQQLSPEIVVWPFLYDQEEIPEVIFKHLGLLRDDQDTSPPYEAWQNI